MQFDHVYPFGSPVRLPVLVLVRLFRSSVVCVLRRDIAVISRPSVMSGAVGAHSALVVPLSARPSLPLVIW